MEYFVVTNSFAAPFLSDQGEEFVEAESPRRALEKVASNYKHPCGLYAAVCYANTDAYHKNGEPLATWLSNHEMAKRDAMKDTRSYFGHAPGEFEADGKLVVVADPKCGRVVEA